MKKIVLILFLCVNVLNVLAQSDINNKEKAKAFFAISDYAKARKLNPDLFRAYYIRGIVPQKLGWI